jgi:hypothetical protein
MTEANLTERIIRKRMHGLYLSRACDGLETLAHELMGLHSWFYRNVPFSALIRGADIAGWKTKLTKTWLYRGTLHGVVYEDLPQLLALHPGGTYLARLFGEQAVDAFAEDVLCHMEDGVYSRAAFRRIFAARYDADFIEAMFSPWGGIFVHLARLGKVAFRDMESRDFDLISAEPTQTPDEVLPDLLRRYFTVYGPATRADAAWFFGLCKEQKQALRKLPLDGLDSFTCGGATYYDVSDGDPADIPALTLLSGFDPYLVSYVERSAMLPPAFKSKVILSSGICNPTIALHGRVAGLWNIKNGEPSVDFFTPQPSRIVSAAKQRVALIRSAQG